MRRTLAGLALAALPLSVPLGLCVALSAALALPPPALAEDQPSLEAPGLGGPGLGGGGGGGSGPAGAGAEGRGAAAAPARLAQRAFDDPDDPTVTVDPAAGIARPVPLDPPVTLEAEERTARVFGIVPRKKSLGLFLAAQAVILIDMGQTLDIRNEPGVVEANPLFGPEPSRERVYAVFGARLAVNTLAHWLLPDRWANTLSMLNLVVGIPVVANNASLGLSVSF